MTALQTKLSSSVTVAQYKRLEESNERQAVAQFVRERFDERYFSPIESTPREKKHGFTILAVCCLVVETLESFYQGLGDTKGKSKDMFASFFSRDTPLKVFGGGNNWFYYDIRCGILHQSETRNGWRVRRTGPLFDPNDKVIDATKFLRELRRAVDTYAAQLVHDDRLWELFKKKMQAVCDNC
jgi:hypothetical protein